MTDHLGRVEVMGKKGGELAYTGGYGDGDLSGCEEHGGVRQNEWAMI